MEEYAYQLEDDKFAAQARHVTQRTLAQRSLIPSILKPIAVYSSAPNPIFSLVFVRNRALQLEHDLDMLLKSR